MTAQEHGRNSVAPGPDGRGKYIHWHRLEDDRKFPRSHGEYADGHFTGGRWLSLDFGFLVEEGHYGEEGDYWCYTVGLARYGHPELTLYGFPYEIACVILSGLAWQVVLGQRRFVSLDSPIMLGGAEVRIFHEESEETLEDHKYLPLANALNGAPVDWIDVHVDYCDCSELHLSPEMPASSTALLHRILRLAKWNFSQRWRRCTRQTRHQHHSR